MLEHIESFTHWLTVRSAILFILLVSMLNLAACGSSGDDAFKEAVKVNALKITSITISSPNTISPPSIIEVGVDEDFIAMAEINSGASAALDISDQVRWSSSDPSVISISSSGSARGIADGTVEIRAELADLFGRKELSASSAELTSVAISLENDLVSIGVCTSGQTFTATGTFEDGRVSDVTSNITWTSSVENVVEIDNAKGREGAVTALIVGDTVISARHENGVISNEWLLAVTDTLDLITVRPDSITINEGDSQQFTAMGSYSDLVDDQDITTTLTWTTENTDGVLAAHLSISNEENKAGLATSTTAGEAEVTASCGDDSVSVAVIVERLVTIASFQINGGREQESGKVGDSPIELDAIIHYSDGSTDEVANDSNTTWSVEVVNSGDGVTVSDTGVVTITAVGNTTIKAVYDDGVSKIARIDIDIN